MVNQTRCSDTKIIKDHDSKVSLSPPKLSQASSLAHDNQDKEIYRERIGMKTNGSKALMGWTLIGSRWRIAAHELVCPSPFPLVELRIILYHLGAAWVDLGILYLYLRTERADLVVERIESAIDSIKFGYPISVSSVILHQSERW
jgi:hypothetical protein